MKPTAMMDALLDILQEKLIISQEDVDSLRKTSERKFDITYSVEFGKFWKSWSHRGKKPRRKAEAYTIWKSFGLDKSADRRERAYRALSDSKASKQWADGYIPDMDKWLKGRPWDDIGGAAPKTDELNIGGTNEW